ncbi:MAG TPA: DnaA/Hda family protein [Rhizobiaceae bacterium]|nr:DnaA/Hda family protein [Rhizobiaceae bacterium]
MAATRQLPFELGHAAGKARDDLVVSRANRAAVSMIDRWPAWPSPVGIVCGPAGSGKSHLAEIWTEAANAVAVEPGAIRPETLAMAEIRPLSIDGVDTAPIDETGLFHLLNVVRAHGGSLLLTARRPPSAWPLGLPDLASRLQAATRAHIDQPDDVLLEAVLTKLFSDRQVAVEPNVTGYLVRRMERSLAEATALVHDLDRAALSLKAPVTRALAQRVLQDRGYAGRTATRSSP